MVCFQLEVSTNQIMVEFVNCSDDCKAFFQWWHKISLHLIEFDLHIL